MTPQPADTFIDATDLFNFLRGEDEYKSAVANSQALGRSSHASPLIIIVGSASILPVEKAIKVYRKLNPKPSIVFTSRGGNFGGNLIWGQSEIVRYRERLQKARVSMRRVLFPLKKYEQSTNTKEEAEHVAEIIKRHHLEGSRSVILCARAVHQRRAYLTYKKQFEVKGLAGIEIHNCPDDEPLTIELADRMCGELERLGEYGAKGDLDPVDIPTQVFQAYCQIRRHLGRAP